MLVLPLPNGDTDVGIIETQKIETLPGYATVEYVEGGVVNIVYYLTLDEKLWRAPFSVDLFASRLYIPGPLAYIKRSFYKNLRLPPVNDTPENQLAIERFNSFIDDHCQEIIDRAVKLGMMEDGSPEQKRDSPWYRGERMSPSELENMEFQNEWQGLPWVDPDEDDEQTEQ